MDSCTCFFKIQNNGWKWMLPNFLSKFVISVSLLWTRDIPDSSRETRLQNYFRSDHLLFPVFPVPFSLSRRFCFLSLSLEHPSFWCKTVPLPCYKQTLYTIRMFEVTYTVYIDLWKIRGSVGKMWVSLHHKNEGIKWLCRFIFLTSWDYFLCTSYLLFNVDVLWGQWIM
jgi:hypothetical protein